MLPRIERMFAFTKNFCFVLQKDKKTKSKNACAKNCQKDKNFYAYVFYKICFTF